MTLEHTYYADRPSPRGRPNALQLLRFEGESRPLPLRAATERDVLSICGLLLTCAATHLPADLTVAHAAEFLGSVGPTSVRRRIEMGFRYHVLADRQTILGVVAAGPGRRLCDLAVAPPFRRRGYARWLLEAATRGARSGMPGDPFVMSVPLASVTLLTGLGFAPAGPATQQCGLPWLLVILESKSAEPLGPDGIAHPFPRCDERHDVPQGVLTWL